MDNLRNPPKFASNLVTDDGRVEDMQRAINETHKVCGKKAKDDESLRIVLLNLLGCWYDQKSSWLSISLNKNFYSVPERYNPLKVSYRSLTRVLSRMSDEGLLEIRKGFKDDRINVRYRTRIRPTPGLIEFFDRLGTKTVKISWAPNSELILLRNENKELIDYEDTHETNSMRASLKAYNEFMLSKSFGLVTNPLRLSQINRPLVRIFNEGRFDKGGRFYGGWWQGIKSKWRGVIVIRNVELFDMGKTVEIDYSGLHIRLLYSQIGVDYKADPYLLEGHAEEARPVLKRLMLIALNADSEQAAIAALKKRLVKDKVEFSGDLEGLISEFKLVKHRPLLEYGFFFSGKGIDLQFLDSKLADKVMSEARSRNILVLPVHDSFITHEKHGTTIQDIMAKAFKELTGLEADLKQAKHSGDWSPLADVMHKDASIRLIKR